MRSRILRDIASLAYCRPWEVAAVLLALTVVSTLYALRLRMDFDWTKFLPPESEAVCANDLIQRAYPKTFDTIIVALQADAPGRHRLLMEAADKMAEAIRAASAEADPPFLAGIDYKIDPSMRSILGNLGDSRLLALMDEAEWSALEGDLLAGSFDAQLSQARVRLQTPFVPGSAVEMDPLGVLDRIRGALVPRFGPKLLPDQGGYAISRNGQVLVMSVRLLRPSSDILFAHHTVRSLEKACKGVLKREGPPIRSQIFASFAGSHVDVTRAVQYVQHDLKWIGVSGLSLMLLLFVMVFRKVEAILYVILPVAFGIDWTLGLAGLLYEEVNVATLVFVFVAVALGLEFCLHIYSRFLDELYRSLDYFRSLEVAFVQTGRGILTSALAGALVFAMLSLTPFEGLRELGTVASAGVLCGLASTLTVLPTMIAFKSRLRRGKIAALALPKLGLDRVAGTIAGYPRATLVMGFLLTVYFAYWTLSLDYRQTPAPYVPTPKLKKLNDQYFRDYPDEIPAPSHPILALISVADLQRALEQNDRLYNNLQAIREKYRLISVDSLRRLLPSIATQEAFRQRLKAFDLRSLSSALEKAGQRQGYSKDAFTPLLAILGRAQALPEDDLFIEFGKEPANNPSFEQAIRQYLTAQSVGQGDQAATLYSIVTAIYPAPNSFAAGDLTRFLIDAGAGVDSVRFTGDALLSRELAPRVPQELARVALEAIGIIFLALTLHFHSPWKALWSMAPVVCVMIWIFGALALTGIHLHFYSMILLPLVAILAIDHNLHFLHRYSERREMWLSLSVVGRAMLTTSLAIMVGFGAVAFANYEGLRHMGLVIILGNGFAFLGSATLLPAAVRLRELGHGLAGIVGADEGVESDIENL